MSDCTVFVGVDIAAKTVTAAWGTQIDDISNPITLKQNSVDWQKLIGKLLSITTSTTNCHVVMEATGTYWMQMAVYLHQAGCRISVINPIRSRYFSRLMMQQTKTDVIDARLLVHFGMVMDLPTWTPPPEVFYELQQRLAYRDDLVAMRIQESNRLHALSHQSTIVSVVYRRIEAHIQQLNIWIKELDQQVESLLRSEHEWRSAADYLLSIPGIGINTAAWILTATLSFSVCTSPDEVTAFAGLAPHVIQSGSSLNSRRSVGKGGHARLRKALYLAALPAIRFNPIVKQFYQRLIARGKPKKVALCAAARKLLHIAWAVVTKQCYFDPQHRPHASARQSSA